jgi:membrane dipeptidase
LKEFDELSRGEEEHALALHVRSIVIDCSVVVKQEDAYFDRAREGGITAHNHTVTDVTENLPEAVKTIGGFLQWVESHNDKALVALRAEDIVRAKVNGKVAFILGPQNANFIEEDLGLVHAFHALGVRINQLTYQYRNQLGDGCGERTDCGLSKFGVRAVEEMNRTGIVVDLSHVGHATSADAMEVSKDPVIFSHSHPKALKPHVRNRTDEELHILAEKGGVIGITSYSPICELKEGVRPRVAEFLRHVDYVVDLIGVNHVGIGLDIDETGTIEKWEAFRTSYPELTGCYSLITKRVEDLESVDKAPNITRGLVARGYSDDEIEKILGGNFLRVFRSVWGG